MDERVIDECIGRLVTLRMHLLNSGMKRAVHHVSAAIDDLSSQSGQLKGLSDPTSFA